MSFSSFFLFFLPFYLFSRTLKGYQSSFVCLEFMKWIFSLLSLIWEGEHTIAIIGRVEGENGFKVYLTSSTSSFWEYFLFYGLAGFCTAWLEGIYYLLSNILSAFPRSFGDRFNTSYHANCCPETRLCFHARSLPSDHASSYGDPRSQNWILYSYFRWRKEITSVFRVLGNHSASFLFPSPCQAIPSGYYTDLCISPSQSTNLGLRSSGSLTSIHYFLQQAGWSWPTFLIPPFNGQSLRPVNSNTEGLGEISYFHSSQWGDHVIIIILKKLWRKVRNLIQKKQKNSAVQSAGAVESSNYISGKEEDPSPQRVT